jgi:hypothetical protein
MKSHLTLIKISDLLHPRKQGLEITFTLRVLFTIVITFAICSTIITTTYNYLTKSLKHLIDFNFYGIKCDRCQYLDCNPHLKCAIHPSIVLTNQAINCKDYQLSIEQGLFRKLPGLLQSTKNFLLKSTY